MSNVDIQSEGISLRFYDRKPKYKSLFQARNKIE